MLVFFLKHWCKNVPEVRTCHDKTNCTDLAQKNIWFRHFSFHKQIISDANLPGMKTHQNRMLLRKVRYTSSHSCRIDINEDLFCIGCVISYKIVIFECNVAAVYFIMKHFQLSNLVICILVMNTVCGIGVERCIFAHFTAKTASIILNSK